MNIGKKVTPLWAFVEFFRPGKKVRDVFFSRTERLSYALPKGLARKIIVKFSTFFSHSSAKSRNGKGKYKSQHFHAFHSVTLFGLSPLKIWAKLNGNISEEKKNPHRPSNQKQPYDLMQSNSPIRPGKDTLFANHISVFPLAKNACVELYRN